MAAYLKVKSHLQGVIQTGQRLFNLIRRKPPNPHFAHINVKGKLIRHRSMMISSRRRKCGGLT
jgi:hypothetical protein